MSVEITRSKNNGSNFVVTDNQLAHYMETQWFQVNNDEASLRLVQNIELSQDSVDKLYLVASRYHPVIKSHFLARVWALANIIPSQLRVYGIEGVALHPFATTPSSDVSEGVMTGEAVALKTFRRTLTQPGEDEDFIRLFFELEVALLAKSHPNILPMQGLHTGPSGEIYLVSKLMKNGPLSHYLESHSEVDRLDILIKLADAVMFLHEMPQPIIHGDLRAFNILVGDAGEPFLMDFGYSLIFDPVTSLFGPKCHANIGNIRWTPKEKVTETEHPLSPKADCFSFASLILEVLSGDLPYAHLRSDGAVIVDVIVRNKLPPRPASSAITDHLWNLMQNCWSNDPAERPTMREIRDFLISLHTESTS